MILIKSDVIELVHEGAPRVFCISSEMLRMYLLTTVLATPTLTDLPSGFASRLLVGSLRSPARLVFSPHTGDLFVVEIPGRLLVWTAASSYAGLPTTALDLRASTVLDTAGERGLLNCAFDPSDSDTIFVSYTRMDGTASRNVISTFVFDTGTLAALPNTERVIFSHDALGEAVTHNAGALFFASGYLFAGHGDNLQPWKAQDLTSTFGKLLRMRADGSVPDDNPFVGRGADAVHGYVYALGLRNPFAATAAPESSDESYRGPQLFAPDVGDWHTEEINVLLPGRNYGWPACEGMVCTGALAPETGSYAGPVFAYGHFAGSALPPGPPIEDYLGCALSAVAVYAPSADALDTSRFPRTFSNVLLAADYCGGAGDGTGGWLLALPFGNGSTFDTSRDRVGPGTVFARGLTENTVSVVVGPASSGPAVFILSRGPTQVDDGSVVIVSYTAEGPPIVTLDLAPTLTLNLNVGDSPQLAVSATGAPPIAYVWEARQGVDEVWLPIERQAGSRDTIFSPPRSTWSMLGTSIRVRVSNSLGTTLSSTAAVERSTLLPPAVKILTASSVKFSGGQHLSFTASSSPSASLSWTAYLNHAFHQHPLFSRDNATSFDFVVPRVGESSANVSISVVARALDPATGLVAVSEPWTLPPQLGVYVLATYPGGLLGLFLDGSAAPTSPTVGVAGMTREVAALSHVVNASGSAFTFEGWADGIAGTHRWLTVPATEDSPLHLTARYADDAAINVAAVAASRTALLTTQDVVWVGCVVALSLLIALCVTCYALRKRRVTTGSSHVEPPTVEREGRAARAPRPSPLSPSMRLRSPIAGISP